MFRKIMPFLLAALTVLPLTAAAEEADVFCFQPEDSLVGICLTSVPEKQGALMLGSRILRRGDVLTAEQAAQMTFVSADPQRDVEADMGYLPVFADRVEKETTFSFSLRGKEDKPPVAEDSAVETYKNLANTGKLKVQDPEGQPMTFTVIRQPKRGTVEIREDGSFTYTPKKNKVGVDSFVFTAADPAGKVSREATVTVTILKPMDSVRYTDTAGQDCCFAAEWMKNTGIFTGEALAGNACFSPEKPVTRGEFISMLVKTLDIPVEETLEYTGYTDEIPVWLKPYLAAAVRSGLTAELPGSQTFGQAEPLTAEEAAAMICCALELEAPEELSIRDTAPSWSERVLTAVRGCGFDLTPETTVTRGETAQLLYQVSQMTKENGRF